MDCDFSHDPDDVPRLIAAVEDGADLALGSRYVPGGGMRELGARCAGSSRAAARSTRASCSACRSATSPAASSATAGACSRRSTSTRSTRKGYAFQIETTYRALRAGFQRRRGADHVRRPRAGGSKMSRAIVARGDLEGAGAPARRALGTSVAATLRSCSRSPTRRSSRTCCRPTRRSSSTSGRRGAARARRSSRSSRSSRPRPRPRRVREAQHRREPGDRRPLRACSRSRR